MSDYQAYDGNRDEWVDLRECSDVDLLAWLDTSRAVGDQVVYDDCVRLLTERGVPGAWSPDYDA